MKLPGMLTANLQLKFLSLLFAAVLWLFVTLETSDEAEIPLAVKIVNMPAGLALKTAPPAQLLLSIAGPRTLLIRQRWKGAGIELDLSGARVGRVKFSGLDRHVRLVPGVRPVRVSPGNLELVVENE